jgi:hypothetical protein
MDADDGAALDDASHGDGDERDYLMGPGPGSTGPRPAAQARERLVGALMVLVMVTLFSLNSQLMRNFTSSKKAEALSPYFVIWCCHALLAVFVPCHFLWFRLTAHAKPEEPPPRWWPCLCVLDSAGLTLRAVVWLSCIYMLCNYAFVKALQFSSVTVDTAIYQCSSVLVYPFSVLYLREEIRPVRIASIVLTVLGVCAITASTPAEESAAGSVAGGAGGAAGVLGICIAIAATTLAAIYQVTFKVLVGRSTRTGYAPRSALPANRVWLLMGLMGAFHIACLWPGQLLLELLGWEPHFRPGAISQHSARMLAVTSGIALLVNALSMFIIHRISPLFLSVGMALTVPASYLCDLLTGQIGALRASTLLGVGLNGAGFVLLLRSEGRQGGRAAVAPAGGATYKTTAA